jgi:hypothetical protein
MEKHLAQAARLGELLRLGVEDLADRLRTAGGRTRANQ